MISYTQKIPGGLVYQNISASDPGGTIRVQCEKHPRFVLEVINNYFETGYASKETLHYHDLALETLAKCPGCKEDAAWKTTKFPEGAEL